MADLPCFKAYDIRGRVPDELNGDLAYRVGVAYSRLFMPRRVAVGYDVRLSSPALQNALAHGLTSCGTEVVDIGLAGTEEVYFAAFQPGIDGGIMVTASHNPKDYNGMKFVRRGAVPISGESGLRELEATTAALTGVAPAGPAPVTAHSFRSEYVHHLRGYIDQATLQPLTIVVNAGNGGAGLIIDALAPSLPFNFVRINHTPDGTFPNGIPNPLLPANRKATADAVRAHKADLGVAWDGDFDRCFLFDENGDFVEGYYVVGLLAGVMLKRYPGAKIVHDPRLTWNTIDLVRHAGGIPIQSKTGHAFIKERMRAEDAVYGGEMSAHHYFRDFAYADNGNLPWLLIASLISTSGKTLSALLGERQRCFPVSGEINRRIADVPGALARVESNYSGTALQVEKVDGLSVEHADWRFNLRASNTEPVLRLNVESRGNAALMREKTAEILELLDVSEAH